MDIRKPLTADNASVMTTDEFVGGQCNDAIVSFVQKLMADGKTQPRSGWVMSEILERVMAKYGSEAQVVARRYFMHLLSNHTLPSISQSD